MKRASQVTMTAKRCTSCPTSFSSAYRDWRSSCSDVTALSAVEGDIPDETINSVCERASTTFIEMASAPCDQPSQLLEKFSALESVLAETLGGNDWADGRDFIILASLKDDLRRFCIEPR
jgi:hypothetical protein